jgi:hypothetical protein
MSSDNFLVALELEKTLVTSPLQKRESTGLNNKDQPMASK